MTQADYSLPSATHHHLPTLDPGIVGDAGYFLHDSHITIPHAPTDTRVSGGNHIIGPSGENRHLLTPTVADEVYMAECPPSVDLPLIGLEEVWPMRH